MEDRALKWLTTVGSMFGLIAEIYGFLGESVFRNGVLKDAQQVHELGIFFFMVSVVSWLKSSASRLEKIDKMETHLKRLDDIARYNASAVSLAKLVNPDTEKDLEHNHYHAAGRSIQEILFQKYASLGNKLLEMKIMNGESAEMEEISVVSKFLKNLMDDMPKGSIWLGVSRLQDRGAWEESTAEPDRWLFEEDAKEKVRKKHLTYFRLFAFETEAQANTMADKIQEQSDLGFDVGVIVDGDKNNPVPDMSLVYIPRKGRRGKVNALNPIKWLRAAGDEFQPLCGLKFDIRADRELRSLTLVAPKADQFNGLAKIFEQHWMNAQRVTPRPTVKPQQGPRAVNERPHVQQTPIHRPSRSQSRPA